MINESLKSARVKFINYCVKKLGYNPLEYSFSGKSVFDDLVRIDPTPQKKYLDKIVD